MPGFLKQSTASQSRALGPFVDDADFKTAETGLTIANTDIKLVINGAASANKNSGGGTHRVNGVYSVTFDATDTATVGEMQVSVVVAGALPVFDKFFVVEEAVYDALFAASAPGYLQPTTAGRTLDVSATGEAGIDWANVGTPGSTVSLSATTVATVTTATNVTTVNGLAANVITAASIASDAITDAKVASDVTIASVTGAVGSVTGAVGSVTAVSSGAITEASFATTAGSFAPLAIVDQGTAQSATGTTLQLRAAAAFADDELIGATILITGGTTGVGQSRVIKDYVSSSDTATVDTWTVTPTGTITYKVFAGPPDPTTPPAVNVTQVIGDPIIASSGKTTNWGGTP
jgi:hypothetical protein